RSMLSARSRTRGVHPERGAASVDREAKRGAAPGGPRKRQCRDRGAPLRLGEHGEVASLCGVRKDRGDLTGRGESAHARSRGRARGRDLGHPLRTGSSFASRKYPFWVTLGEGVIDVPIKDDRPGSLRTECFELQPGKAGARAARAVVDDLARDLGELYEDTRLLVSELVTAGAERLDENTAPRLELSIYKTWLNVELVYEGADADAVSLDKSVVG